MCSSDLYIFSMMIICFRSCQLPNYLITPLFLYSHFSVILRIDNECIYTWEEMVVFIANRSGQTDHKSSIQHILVLIVRNM